MSKSYGTISGDLRRVFANVIKKTCKEKLPVDTTKDETPLEAFLACRLIPLDKNPGLRPIGAGEVLRRIAGKVVMKVVKEDIKKAAGCLQLCAGQEAGCEAAIHAMQKIFESNKTEAILIVDAENAFNSINRKVLLRNIEYLCPANVSRFSTTVMRYLLDSLLLVEKNSDHAKEQHRGTQQQWQRIS